MMYQGRNFDHISQLLIGDGGADDRAGSEGLLFLGRCASLRQTLEALESVIDEYPVLVYYLAVLWHRRGCCNEIKLKDVIKSVSFSTSIECNGNVTGKEARTYLQFHVWKFVKVGRIVDGSHLDRYGGRSFPNVLPIDTAEEGCQFELLNASLRP